MRDFSISTEINASPERVWEVMSDGERWAEWTPSVTSVEIFDKPLRVGTRARILQPELPPAKFIVTALEPGRSFTWGTGIPGIVYVHAHHSVEPGPLGVRATLRLHFGGLLGGVMGKKYTELNNRYLRMEIAGLKRASEDGIKSPGEPLAQWHAEAMRRLK